MNEVALLTVLGNVLRDFERRRPTGEFNMQAVDHPYADLGDFMLSRAAALAALTPSTSGGQSDVE